MSGAHFYRCDFQVHTPRDTNWNGTCPRDEDERKRYAEDFIAACRGRGLHAVAITDHHDVAFCSYIRRAAEEECDDAGNLLQPAHRIIVFPGMELTLGVPCQALLILDSDFPVNLLTTVPRILGVDQNDPSQQKHTNVSRLEHIKSIRELCELLDTHDHLRHRYIVLPNVGESGDVSLLRKGFSSHYKDMPCVGGYVDGSLEQLGTGNKSILAGKVKEYGHRRLAVFQTSDSRNADFSDLGRHSSWVKWAVPTAEALRQACLAQDTRISNSEPRLPSLIVESMEVSNSKFMGPIVVDFNPQLNCIIGGRGTGKSTILEYLRWALCDQPPAFDDAEELPDFQKKRASLIANTLLPLDAVVTVTFTLNGIPHVVRRNARRNALLLKVGNEEFTECTEEALRSLLPIQAYSQKQLSTVGVRTEELARFVMAPIDRNLREFKLRQEELRTRLRTAYATIQAKQSLEREQEKEKLETASLEKQLQQLRGQLKGLSEDDKAVLTQHDAFLEEERRTTEVARTLADWQGAIRAVTGDIQPLNLLKDLPKESPNYTLLSQMSTKLSDLHKVIQGHLSSAVNDLDTSASVVSEIGRLTATFSKRFEDHDKLYEAAKSRSSSHESRLAEITKAEQRIKLLRGQVDDRARQIARHGDPAKDYSDARREWNTLHSDRADVLERRCEELTALSSGRIRARLHRAAGVQALRDRLYEVVSGTRIRTKKVDDLCDQIISADDSREHWDSVQRELEQLAGLDASEDSQIEIPSCPLLARAGFAASDLEKLARRFTVESWLEVSLAELTDVPVFEYQQREGDYIAFSDASAGQQATVLLRVLLNQEGPPLIIDQPEEDLDNPVILEIVEEIWNAKAKRQILFSSHNANIVVNGDADLVVCCDYRTAGDQSGGQIKSRGAIDMDVIRDEITKVMEGGRAAFQLRKEKYGF